MKFGDWWVSDVRFFHEWSRATATQSKETGDAKHPPNHQYSAYPFHAVQRPGEVFKSLSCSLEQRECACAFSVAHAHSLPSFLVGIIQRLCQSLYATTPAADNFILPRRATTRTRCCGNAEDSYGSNKHADKQNLDVLFAFHVLFFQFF